MNQGHYISTSESKFILEGCQDGCRPDGRARNEFRLYTTVAGGTTSKTNLTSNPPLILSQGSARVFLATGETDVLVSVKAEMVRPAVDRPNHGVLSVHVDSANKLTEELEPTLANLLLPHLLDTRSLCIVPNLYAWKLHIDVLILVSDGGSLLDACSLGINAALSSTILPNVIFSPAENGGKQSLQLDSDFAAGNCLTSHLASRFIITATMLKCPMPLFILDATKAEEACANAQVHVVVDTSEDSPKICSLQTSGKEPLSVPVFQDATTFVLKSTPRTYAKTIEGSQMDLFLQPSFVLQSSSHRITA